MLYHLARKYDAHFEEMTGCIVRAKNMEDARRFAAEFAKDEGPETWLNPKLSSCECLNLSGVFGMIIYDVNWG